MSFIFFSQLIFGHLFVIRILRRYHSRKLIEHHLLAKIGTVAMLWISITSILVRSHANLTFLCMVANLIATFFLLERLERRQIDTFNERFGFFLDRWSMNLKLGLAPTTGRSRALAQENSHLRGLLEAVFHSDTTKSSARDHFLSDELVKELREADRADNSIENRLESLRHQHRQNSEFRRKSGQAILQARIQSVTMLVLLFAMQLIAVRRFGWHKVGDLVMLSFTIAVLGLIWLNWLARKRRWSI